MDVEQEVMVITKPNILDVYIRNIQSLSEEEYALARKDTFGASDSSILCGVNLYKDMDALLKEKNCKYLTAEEKEVGKKPAVRKGRELEPLILFKAQEELGIKHLIKPNHMYMFKSIRGLTVNFDGVDIDNVVPIEAKLVTRYGEKYYNKNITEEDAKKIPMDIEGTNIVEHIKRKATKFGIPAYYYTQVQQQIAGLDTDHGYLAALFDETWTFKTYYIKRDDYVINHIYDACTKNIDKITKKEILN